MFYRTAGHGGGGGGGEVITHGGYASLMYNTDNDKVRNSEVAVLTLSR